MYYVIMVCTNVLYFQIFFKLLYAHCYVNECGVNLESRRRNPVGSQIASIASAIIIPGHALMTCIGMNAL